MNVNAATSPSRCETLETPGAEIVNHEDFDTVVNEPIDEIGSDEPGATGDEGLRNHLTSKLGVDDRCGWRMALRPHRRLDSEPEHSGPGRHNR